MSDYNTIELLQADRQAKLKAKQKNILDASIRLSRFLIKNDFNGEVSFRRYRKGDFSVCFLSHTDFSKRCEIYLHNTEEEAKAKERAIKEYIRGNRTDFDEFKFI